MTGRPIYEEILLLSFGALLTCIGGVLLWWLSSTSEFESSVGSMERSMVLDIVSSESPTAVEGRACRLLNSDTLTDDESYEILAGFVAREFEHRCKKVVYLDPSDGDFVASCKNAIVVVTDSCRAYDKSGVFQKPRASCKLNLSAPEGYFFLTEKVDVVHEKYREPTKSRAGDAEPSGKSTTAEFNGQQRTFFPEFSGQIGCTNDRGTGRTCESRATISAVAVPEKCLVSADKIIALQTEELKAINTKP